MHKYHDYNTSKNSLVVSLHQDQTKEYCNEYQLETIGYIERKWGMSTQVKQITSE